MRRNWSTYTAGKSVADEAKDFPLVKAGKNEAFFVTVFNVTCTHATNTLRAELGILQGAEFVPLKSSATVAAAGGSVTLESLFCVKDGEQVVARLTGSADPTTFQASAVGYTLTYE